MNLRYVPPVQLLHRLPIYPLVEVCVRHKPAAEGLRHMEQLEDQGLVLLHLVHPVEEVGYDLDYVVGLEVQSHLEYLREGPYPRECPGRRAVAADADYPCWIHIIHPQDPSYLQDALLYVRRMLVPHLHLHYSGKEK